MIDQMRLGEPERSRESLEELPFKFRYRYYCQVSTCSGHRHSIIDWEIGQAYRSWRARYGDEQVLGKIRQKWFKELASPKRDTYFMIGNAHQFPNSFMVLGVVWPPARPQLSLF